MEKIISKTNTKIKHLKKLTQKKQRVQDKLFVLENFISIKDALFAGFDFKELYISDNFYGKNLDELKLMFSKSKCDKIFLIDNALEKSISNLDKPSGIAAVYEMHQKNLSQNKPVIYLNSINDPGNLGTIVRAMPAFGFENLVLDDTCTDIYNPKTLQASKDAIFKINVHYDHDLKWLKNSSSKIPVLASVVSGGEDIAKFKNSKNYCLVIGSESHGVSQEILGIANQKISIKISKNMESLNAGIAASIFMYELSKNKK